MNERPIEEGSAEDNKARVVVPDAGGEAPVSMTLEQARQGRTGGGVRYVLAASLVGVILLFVLTYFIALR